METLPPLQSLPGFSGSEEQVKVLRELWLAHVAKEKQHQEVEDLYQQVIKSYEDLRPKLQELMADMLTFIAPASSYLGCTGFGGQGAPELLDSISMLYELVQTEVTNDFIEDHCIMQIRQYPSLLFQELSSEARQQVSQDVVPEMLYPLTARRASKGLKFAEARAGDQAPRGGVAAG